MFFTCLDDITRQAFLWQRICQLSNILVEQSLMKLATLNLVCTDNNSVFPAFCDLVLAPLLVHLSFVLLRQD